MEELATSIYVAIRTAPKNVKRGIFAKRPQDGDRFTAELTAIIMSALKHYDIIRKPGTKCPDAAIQCSPKRLSKGSKNEV